MRSKLNFLINVSLNKKIKSKWFLISNIVIAILMIGIINIDSIITFFGGDFDSQTKIYIVDETKMLKEDFKSNLEIYEKTLYNNTDIYDVIISNEKKNVIEQKILKEEKNSYLLFFEYKQDEINSQLITYSTIDTYAYQLISNAVSDTIKLYNLNEMELSQEELKKIMSPIPVERVILSDEITNEAESTEMIMSTVFPILILPFFMLTIFLVQLIGSEVNDEKSTRSMEIIISNVSPQKHFAAKIISNNLFIFFQIILILIYICFALFMRKIIGGDSIMNGVIGEVGTAINSLKNGIFNDKFIIILVLTFVLMFLTFIAYSIFAGVLASMSTNAEDYQQIQVPIVIILLLGYYLSIMAGLFKGSIFIKIFAIIPFISAIVAPSLLVMGQIGMVEIILALVLLILTIYLLIKYGMRIYKVGILNYSSSGIWNKMLKSLRNN